MRAAIDSKGRLNSNMRWVPILDEIIVSSPSS